MWPPRKALTAKEKSTVFNALVVVGQLGWQSVAAAVPRAVGW